MDAEHNYPATASSSRPFVPSGRFLYRACAKGQSSKLRKGDKVGIYAGKFKKSSAADIDLVEFISSRNAPLSQKRCDEVLTHMVWRNRVPTEWVSLSFSLPWAVYRLFCIRPYCRKLVVVDWEAVADHAETAVGLLQKIEEEKGATDEIKQARRWAKEAKEVLVYGYVPPSAVLCVIEWDKLQQIVPSWLRTKVFKNISPKKYSLAAKHIQQARLAVSEARAIEEATDFVHSLFKSTSLHGPQPDAVVEAMVLDILCWPIRNDVKFVEAARNTEPEGSRRVAELVAVFAEAGSTISFEPQSAPSSIAGDDDDDVSDPEPVSDDSQSATKNMHAIEQAVDERNLGRSAYIAGEGLSSDEPPYPSSNNSVHAEDEVDEDEGYESGRSAGYRVSLGSNPARGSAFVGLVVNMFSFLW